MMLRSPARLGRPESGSSGPPPIEPGKYYCVRFDMWDPGSTCETIDRENPDSTAVFSILGSQVNDYGGWNTCYWGVALGCLIIRYLSGPYDTEECDGNC